VDRTPEEWRTVFLITAGVYALGALLYGLLASGEKQDWADGDTGLLDVEKEKNEFYSYTEKDYSYGATESNGQYRADYEEEGNYDEDGVYYEEEADVEEEE